ncbi:MAG: MATE family efflux transporter [Erysipelotrichaceae bacterium]|nr:MATE family efflux transporter [Erysipelotrichaceae bacterium]
MAKTYRMDMTEGSLLPKILMFSFPLMLSSLLQLLFNAADIIVVGRFAGHQALAAVSSTGALVNLIVNLFMGLSVGTNVLVARQIGAKQFDEMRKTVHTAICMSLVGGVILTVFGIVMARPLLQLMSVPSDVIDLSTLYLQIYFAGITAMLLYNYGASILRAKGDTKRPLYFLAIAGVVNVALNLVLVVFFHMGVAGVGIATTVSQVISAYMVFTCLKNEPGPTQLIMDEMKIDWPSLKEIMKIGLPAGIQGSVFSLSNVVIQSTVNGFGSAVMAGNGAASNIEGFVYVAMNAFYQSCLTFTSQNYGAKKMDRVLKTAFSCQFLVIVVGLITGIGAWYFGEPLLGIYTTELPSIEAGMIRLSYVCKVYFLCGIMDVMVGTLRGLGYSIFPMFVSLMGACVFRLVWIAFIFPMNPIIDTVYISYPISWFITATFHILTFVFVWGKVKKKLAAEA